MSQEHDDSPTTQRTVLSPGPAHQAHRTACLVVIHGEGLGRRVDLDERPVVLGRSPEVDLQIAHPSVSRRHCEVWLRAGHFMIRDLGATNRTRVNDQAITETALVDGDHVTLGETVLKFISRHSLEARYHEEVYQLATHDALTGLFNRRQFIELIEHEIARAHRQDTPMALCMVDVDLFKPINDRFGHIAGDAVLRQLGGLIAASVGGDQVAARIGGEEFAVLLPATGGAEATRFAEGLRGSVEADRFTPGGEHCPLTVSIGVAVLGADGNRSVLMRAADEALYRAKSRGRNRVELAG